jgi:hypothetical protein
MLLGSPRQLGGQDARTVRLLRLGVGAIGTLLPIGLIAGNLAMGNKEIIPASMSGSYYTSTRNLFVGALCALGVFLIGYRHTQRQNRCTSFAGACALLVAYDPTAPPRPHSEPAWVNYVHHCAAGALLFTLGLFCWVVFADYALAGTVPPATVAGRLRAWLSQAWNTVRRGGRGVVYLASGLLIFVSGGLALYTGLWPTSWSTGWQSCYLFEAVAVVGFGVAWFAAGLQGIATPAVESIRPPAVTRPHELLVGHTAA